MKKLISLLVLVAFSTLLPACNTMEGFGRDVGRVGDKIERKAEERRN
ncbi:MAG: entericidin A/B family lipoprotein [Pseudomonadota bacterium]